MSSGRFIAPITLIAFVILGSPGIRPADLQAQEEGNETTSSRESLDFFESKIRPVLVDKCYKCHSEESGKSNGGLRVDSREALLLGGDSGAAIEPGNPDDSLLMLAISYEDEDYAMPPANSGGQLPKDVIRDFRKWIKDGAADPRVERIVSDPGAGEEAKAWWAFQPLTQPAPPATPYNEWSDQPIDRFVYAKMIENNLQPVGMADPATLIRRVYFDLIGLPPEPAVAKSFVEKWNATGNEEAQQKLFAETVDRLLESPQYGEHWGRHWMDVVRFAESSGKDVNVLFPYAWRYRDYIIESLNQDVPYDQFLKEQLAGDLMDYENDEQRSRQLIATGFLAIGTKSINDQNPRQLAVDIADEQIDAFSQGFLGVTIACARCHDHKFDPISQMDYTAVAGIFLSTDTHYGTTGGVNGRNKTSLISVPTTGNDTARRSLSKNELERLQEQLKRLQDERTKLVRERLQQRRGGNDNNGNELLRVNTQINGIETVLSEYDEDGKPRSLAMGVEDKPATAPASFGRLRFGNRQNSGFVSISDSPLFIRGEVDRPSDRIDRSVPDWFEFVPDHNIPRRQSGRLQLAEWVVEPTNPLTTRVMTNRIWHWLMGAGIVSSVDNFGTTGSTPSHPELLDYLANQFLEHDYSIKSMVRMIVLSKTYQLASSWDDNYFKTDPNNRYLWRHNPKRLEAESIRDAILATSGQLDLKPPTGSMIGKAGDGVVGRDRFGVSEDDIVNQQIDHRTVYMALTRDVEPEILAVFDGADASVVQGARQSTNVPGQALFMLNSRFAEDAAEAIAERVAGPLRRVSRFSRGPKPEVNTKTFPDQFNEMCWLVFGRPASSREEASAKKLLLTHRDDPKLAWTSIARAMLASAEFRNLD